MKDIVVEEVVNPDVDKPSKKKTLDIGGQDKPTAPALEWDAESTPLVPRGPGKPALSGGNDKYNVNEVRS